MLALTEELRTYEKVLFPQTFQRRLLIHLVFWTSFVGFHLMLFLAGFDDRLSDPVLRLAYVIYYIRFSLLYYVTVGLFRGLRKHVEGVWRLLLLGLGLLMVAHLINVFLYPLYDHLFGITRLTIGFQKGAYFFLNPLNNEKGKFWRSLIIDISELQLLAFPLGIKMMKYGIHLVMKESVRENQKLKQELIKLRTLLTPHLIFNLLNGASRELSNYCSEASRYLMQMADMIRFAIYDISGDLVDLSKELNFVSQYLELSSRQTGHKTKIVFINECPNRDQYQIPTLVLVTLIENAFKHGVHATHGKSYVLIECTTANGFLVCTVVNSKPVTDPVFNQKPDKGIGLENIRQTLRLRFKDEYILEITESEKEFSVYLKIPLIDKRTHPV